MPRSILVKFATVLTISGFCGCASQSDKASVEPLPPPHEPRGAAALAFDVPAAWQDDVAQPATWREGREVEAFAGYDEGVATFFYIHQDDRQQAFGDNLFRRTISSRIGVTYR